jgi:uncharacterized protein YbjT (DUF2867 family)
MTTHNAIVFGATGLIGAHLLKEALAQPAIAHVTAVTRRPIAARAEKLTNLVTPLEELAARHWPGRIDLAFCCLGSTIGQAGSREVFRHIDCHLVLAAARFARAHGARHFLVVSAVGASSNSPVFYNRVKGDMERGLEALGFERLSVFRPSLLMGERAEHRPGEALGLRVMPVVAPLLAGPLSIYRPIAARDVARGMLGAALAPAAGATRERLHYTGILAAAARLPA